MKKYLLFSGVSYYPCGGFSDFMGDFLSIEDAKLCEAPTKKTHDWAHIVDTETMMIVLMKRIWTEDDLNSCLWIDASEFDKWSAEMYIKHC